MIGLHQRIFIARQGLPFQIAFIEAGAGLARHIRQRQDQRDAFHIAQIPSELIEIFHIRIIDARFARGFDNHRQQIETSANFSAIWRLS